MAYGYFSELLGIWRGRPAQVNAAVANNGHYFSPAKACAEVGIPQKSIDQAAAEAFTQL